MRAHLLIAMYAACASTPKGPQVLVDPPKALDTVAPQQAAAVPALDEATVKAKSREFLAAVDNQDARTFADTVSSTFSLFYQQRLFDGPRFAEMIAGQRERHVPVHSRVYAEEKVFLAGASAIYLGHDTEHVPSDGEHPAVDRDGWDTLVWTRDADRWRLAHWGWQAGGLDAERSMWDQTYREGVGFNQKPNQLLVDTVKGVKPGTALDLAMGQGRNAVFLANAGWKVTGVDISEEGMRIAREKAPKLVTINATIEAYDPGVEKFDLVTLIYAGDDHAVIAKAQKALRHKGLFVAEFFAKSAGTNIGGFAPGELAALFKDGWKILVDAQVEDTADWASQRKLSLARFVAQRL